MDSLQTDTSHIGTAGVKAFGATGVKVSGYGLGTMTWGRDTDEYEAAKQLELFLENHGSYVDSASSFGDGAGQIMLGQLLPAFAETDIFISAKSGGNRDSQRPFDNSRRKLLKCLNATLERLHIDRLDLWMLHGFDAHTPVHETLDALAWAIDAGIVSYVGLCNWPATWVAHAQTYLSQVHRVPLACVQVEYSLVNRTAENLLLPYSCATGVSVVAWSPLGRGVLSGKYRYGTPSDSRGASSHLRSFVAPYLGRQSAVIVEAVCAAAEGLGVAPIDVALAWIRTRSAVTTSLLGARTAAQLRGILEGAPIDLPIEITTALDEVSVCALTTAGSS